MANLLASAAFVPGIMNGGLQAALVEFNLGREKADLYVEGVKAGGLLFFMRTEDKRISEAAEILRANKAEQIVTTAG